MSLDYPFYEELKRRGHPAAKWWYVGDMLYYLGLLPALLCIPVMAIQKLTEVLGFTWWWSGSVTVACFGAGLAIFFIGGFIKGRSYSMAERDRIDVKKHL